MLESVPRHSVPSLRRREGVCSEHNSSVATFWQFMSRHPLASEGGEGTEGRGGQLYAELCSGAA